MAGLPLNGWSIKNSWELLNTYRPLTQKSIVCLQSAFTVNLIYFTVGSLCLEGLSVSSVTQHSVDTTITVMFNESRGRASITGLLSSKVPKRPVTLELIIQARVCVVIWDSKCDCHFKKLLVCILQSYVYVMCSRRRGESVNWYFIFVYFEISVFQNVKHSSYSTCFVQIQITESFLLFF